VNQSPQPFIILASASPRRQELLKAVGLSFIVLPPSNGNGIDETPLSNETPAALVQRLSRLKAKAIADRLTSPNPVGLTNLPAGQDMPTPPWLIIAADTVVVLEGRILGKPTDAAEARYMLTQLRRQAHAVFTGLTVAYRRSQQWRFITRLHQSTVWMRPYSDAEIEMYIASGDPLDKAGAYAIQHQTFEPVERLQGCFASVMGLPLGELAAAFTELGLSLPPIGPRCTAYNHYPCCQTPLSHIPTQYL
jgi:MAF protein